MSLRLPQHGRALLAIFAKASTPLSAADAVAMLQKQVSLRLVTTGYRLAIHLRKAGLIRFADISSEEAVDMLRNIVQAVDRGDPLPSIGRYKLTDRGRAWLRRQGTP